MSALDGNGDHAGPDEVLEVLVALHPSFGALEVTGPIETLSLAQHKAGQSVMNTNNSEHTDSQQDRRPSSSPSALRLQRPPLPAALPSKLTSTTKMRTTTSPNTMS